MNCANHPETAAVAYCRTCGKPLCEICQRPAQGTVFCQEHEPAAAAANPYAAPPRRRRHTSRRTRRCQARLRQVCAFVLGLIPGVGAIYNGQYAKGLIHVVILGFLISIMSSGAAHGMEPMIGLLIPLLFFYMAFEAYHTASKRLRGEVVDEFSGTVSGGTPKLGLPLGPIVLILLRHSFSCWTRWRSSVCTTLCGTGRCS